MAILSFCIPTYNRKKILVESINNLLPIIKKWDVDIYISDNHSDDGTKEYIESIETDKIKWFRQDKNWGSDKNFEYALKMSKSRYRWLWGDSDRISEEGFCRVWRIIQKEEYEIIYVNGRNTHKESEDKEFSDSKEFIREYSSFLTLASSIIVSNNIIKDSDFEKFYGTNFIHVGICIEYLVSNHNIKIYACNKNCFNVTNITKNNWFDKYTDICIGWYHMIAKIDNIDNNFKSELFSKIGETIMSRPSLIWMRGHGKYIRYNDYRNNKEIILKETGLSPLELTIIYGMPSKIARYIWHIWFFYINRFLK